MPRLAQYVIAVFLLPAVTSVAQPVRPLFQRLDETYRSGLRELPVPPAAGHGRKRIVPVQGVDAGLPRLLQPADAAANTTLRLDRIHPGGWHFYSADGSTETLGIWDAGKPRLTHQEFGSRVLEVDTASVADNSHATAVAGAAAAVGTAASAKGSAPAVQVRSYNWDNDAAEMAHAAGQGLRLSVHPYAETAGWTYNLFGDGRWVWYADTTVDATRNFAFGFYGQQPAAWDEIAASAPAYLIVKAAGNLRGITPSPQPVEHWVPYYDNGWNWRLSRTVREANGGSAGYETLSHASVAKNVLTIASVQTIPGGYTGPADVLGAADSGTGPTDDGRIKPDLAAPGVSLYMPAAGGNAAYQTGSGTSYAAGAAAGAAAALASHVRAVRGSPPPAALLKALLIHTAREAGPSRGPDYRFGFGLMDAAAAARTVSAAGAGSPHAFVLDTVLQQGQTLSFPFTLRGRLPLRVTAVWTDPAHAALAAASDPVTPVLVNDLDLRVNSGVVHYPWKLNRSAPEAAATRSGDNAIDNVEVIDTDTLDPGSITITVTHKGSLAGGSQRLALIWTAGEPRAEARLQGAAGWRLLAWPAEADWSAIHQQIPVQGISGAPGGTAFPVNLYSGYTGSTWQAPAAISGSTTAGKGFLMYVYNNSNAGSRPLPYVLGAAGPLRPGDVTVPLHAAGDKFNLVGNPFDAALDASLLSTSGGSMQADGQLWIPGTGWRLTSDAGDSVGAFQGFFVENNDATSITFPVAARRAGGRLHRMAPAWPGFKIRLKHPDGLTNPDEGFAVIFRPEAQTGRDPWDASKLWPMAAPFAAAAGVMEQNPMARIALPTSFSGVLDIPVQVLHQGAGQVSMVEFSLSAPLPEGVTVTWRGSDGLIRPLSEGSTWTERLPAQKMALPEPPVFFKFTDAQPPWAVLRLERLQTGTEAPNLKRRISLHGWPNPFNPDVFLRLDLIESSAVRLTVLDIMGRTVATLAEGRYAAGAHNVRWHAGTAASGVYLFVLESGGERVTRRMILLK